MNAPAAQVEKVILGAGSSHIHFTSNQIFLGERDGAVVANNVSSGSVKCGLTPIAYSLPGCTVYDYIVTRYFIIVCL